jgi:hypothetical protein
MTFTEIHLSLGCPWAPSVDQSHDMRFMNKMIRGCNKPVLSEIDHYYC